MKPNLSLIFLLLIGACIGQGSPGTPPMRETTASSPADSLRKDPLFYIDGQLCQHVRQIFQDSRGDLWFGTNVYDIMRYDGDTLVYFTEKDNAGGGRVTGILEDEVGNVWFGTYRGLVRYDGHSFVTFTTGHGLPVDEIWSLYLDDDGLIWVGTNVGVSYFDGQSFFDFPVPKATVKDTNTIYAYDRITGILKDNAGRMWFGTDGFGITVYDGKSFTHFTDEDGLCNNNIGSLFRDSKGNIWVGTMFGGICRYDGNAFTGFSEEDGVGGQEAGAFFEDENGDLWFAVENHGVYRYDGTSFVNFTEKDGLNTNGILAIRKDREERFWFGGWGGLFRYVEGRFTSVTKEGPWE